MPKYKKRADGRYCAYVDFGRDSDGKRIRKMAYGKSIRELEDNILKLKIQRTDGQLIKNSDTEFYKYALSWLETYKTMTSLNTKAMYTNVIEKHLKNEIGHLPIGSIQKSDIQRIINNRQEHYETCNKILLTLRQIFNSALDDDMIRKSPVKGISLPSKPASTKRALTELEKKAILAAELEPVQKCFIDILFYCGLRREEALALTKSDFDFSSRTISINRAIIFDKNTPVLSTTKTELSTRTIPIPANGLKEIKSYVDNITTLYLFTKKDGSLMTHSSYVKFWNGIIKELNRAVMTDSQWQAVESMPKNIRAKNRPITGLTAHIFRHNYATMLYYSGISIKKAAALMGHSSTKMIMEVYSHLDEEKEQTLEKLDENIRIS